MDGGGKAAKAGLKSGNEVLYTNSFFGMNPGLRISLDSPKLRSKQSQILCTLLSAGILHYMFNSCTFLIFLWMLIMQSMPMEPEISSILMPTGEN